MPVAQDKDQDDDLDAEQQVDQEAEEEAGEQTSPEEQEEDQPAAAAAAEDTEAEQEQQPATLSLTSPTDASQYDASGKVVIEFECTGSGQFDAKFVVNGANGPLELQQTVDLDDEGNGQGKIELDVDQLGGAGKYEVVAGGASGGDSASVQKVGFEIVDENADEDAVAQQTSDDGATDEADV
jgi:hypothetical protein